MDCRLPASINVRPMNSSRVQDMCNLLGQHSTWRNIELCDFVRESWSFDTWEVRQDMLETVRACHNLICTLLVEFQEKPKLPISFSGSCHVHARQSMEALVFPAPARVVPE